MSEYVLNIKLKDPQGLFKQIQDLEKNGIGGKAAAASGGGGGFFGKKLGDLNLGMLAKLTGIGFGIHQLVQLGIKSSGILQGTFKMFEMTAMLMLKPVADFVGLMLRPLAIMLLTTVMPHLPAVLKWVREWGPKIGDMLVGGIKQPSVTGTALSLTGGLGGVASPFFGQFMEKALGILGTQFNLFGLSLGIKLAGIPGQIYERFVTFGTAVYDKLASLPGLFWFVFKSAAESLWFSLTSIPGLILGVFTGLANGLIEALSSIPQLILNAITGWIPGLQLPGSSPNRPGMPRASGRATMAGVADTVRP